MHQQKKKPPTSRYADINEVIAALSSVVAPEVSTITPASNGGPSHLAPTSSGLHQLVGGGENGPLVPPTISAPSGTMISRPAASLSETHSIPVPRENTPTVPLIPVLIEPKLDSVPMPSEAPAMPPDAAPSPPVPSPSGIHPVPVSREPMPASESTAPKIIPPPPPKESGLTALPPGATRVLGKVTRRAASEYSVFDMPALDFPHEIPPPARPKDSEPKPPIPKLQAPALPEGLVPIKDEVIAEPTPMPKLQAPALPEGSVPIKDEVVEEPTPIPKLQAPAMPEGLVPIKDEVVAEQPPMPKLPAPVSPEGLVPIKKEVVAEQPSPPPPQPANDQLSLEERLGPIGMVVLGLILIAVVFILGYLIFPH